MSTYLSCQGSFWKSSIVSNGVTVHSCPEGFTRSLFLDFPQEKNKKLDPKNETVFEMFKLH